MYLTDCSECGEQRQCKLTHNSSEFLCIECRNKNNLEKGYLKNPLTYKIEWALSNETKHQIQTKSPSKRV